MFRIQFLPDRLWQWPAPTASACAPRPMPQRAGAAGAAAWGTAPPCRGCAAASRGCAHPLRHLPPRPHERPPWHRRVRDRGFFFCARPAGRPPFCRRRPLWRTCAATCRSSATARRPCSKRSAQRAACRLPLAPCPLAGPPAAEAAATCQCRCGPLRLTRRDTAARGRPDQRGAQDQRAPSQQAAARTRVEAPAAPPPPAAHAWLRVGSNEIPLGAFGWQARRASGCCGGAPRTC